MPSWCSLTSSCVKPASSADCKTNSMDTGTLRLAKAMTKIPFFFVSNVCTVSHRGAIILFTYIISDANKISNFLPLYPVHFHILPKMNFNASVSPSVKQVKPVDVIKCAKIPFKPNPAPS